MFYWIDQLKNKIIWTIKNVSAFYLHKFLQNDWNLNSRSTQNLDERVSIVWSKSFDSVRFRTSFFV